MPLRHALRIGSGNATLLNSWPTHIVLASISHIIYHAQRHYWLTLLLAVNNSVVVDTIARLSKNKKLPYSEKVWWKESLENLANHP